MIIWYFHFHCECTLIVILQNVLFMVIFWFNMKHQPYGSCMPYHVQKYRVHKWKFEKKYYEYDKGSYLHCITQLALSLHKINRLLPSNNYWTFSVWWCMGHEIKRGQFNHHQSNCVLSLFHDTQKPTGCQSNSASIWICPKIIINAIQINK